MVFDKQWFEQHQSKLLKLSNHSVLKYWFRRVLRINKDLKWSERVTKLAPNNFEVSLGTFLVRKELREKIRADFRTNDKFAARLYHAFRPMWWIMHFMDWAFFERVPLLHNLDFGFSTLTVYPDPGSGATTVSGYASRRLVDETFANIIAGAGNFIALNFIYVYLESSSTTANRYKELTRGIMTFDTSSLGSGATISAADFEGYVQGKAAGLGSNFSVYVTPSSPASDNDIVNADYSAGSSTILSTVAYSAITTSAYNTHTISPTTTISKTGITRLGLRNSWDRNASFTGTWAGATSSYVIYDSSSATGTSQDPKLVITYTKPPTIVTLNETVTVTETFGKSITKAFNEALNLSDMFLSNVLSFLIAVFSGSYMTAGAPVAQYPVADGKRVKYLSVTMNEILSVTDGFSKVLNRVWDEALALTDSFVSSLVKIRVWSETVNLTDQFCKSFARIFNETLSLSDTFLKAFVRIWTETLSLTSTFIKTFTYIMEFSETLILNDTLFKYVNGVLLDIWTKTAKITSTWTKAAKAAATWIKTPKS